MRCRSFLLALVLALVVATPTALAGEVTVPDVTGMGEAEAKAALEALGLVHSTEIQAGNNPGKILSQVPAPGAVLETGDEVVLRICCSANIQTQAPDVVGMTEAHARSALEDAYVLTIEYTSGDAAKAGKVIAQDPAPNTSVPFRAPFAITVVRNSALVPSLLGQSLADARAALKNAGLLSDVLYVEDKVAERGTVIGQDPRSGSEILPGSTIVLRVVGPAPEGGDDTEQVAVPSVVGQSMSDAEEALLAVGLFPHVLLIENKGQEPWVVLSQDVDPGAMADPGTHVHIEVPKAATTPSQVHLPSLYGLTEAEAVALLQQMGLYPVVTRVVSALPTGIVIFQSPSAGELVSLDSNVSVRVAKAPPPDWTIPLTTVPNLDGLTPNQARMALLTRGLGWRMRRAIGPNLPLNRVFKQSHAPGLKVQVATMVTYYIPYQAQVPQLLGKTKAAAIALLEAAGLAPIPQGPLVGVPPTKVIHQSVGAGHLIARGSGVKFNYKFTGILPVLVTVPNTLNKTTATAEAMVQAKDLVAKFVGPAVGIGAKRVVSQNPAPGTKVAKGTQVTMQFKYTGLLLAKVTVPAVTFKTLPAAKALIEAQSLKVQAIGPAVGIGVTKVTSQWPPAGTKVFAGTTVKVHYVWTGFKPIPIAFVVVPHVVGQKLTTAQAILQAKGLKWSSIGPAVGLGAKTVTSQSPIAGSKVLPGSTITIHFKYGGIVLALTKVPSVTGLKKGQAAAKIAAAGLKVKWKYFFGNKKAIAQSPAPGTTVAKGSTVTVTLGP